MIEEKFVDLYARNSGLRDKLVAERDVVLTYALRALFDTGLMNHLQDGRRHFLRRRRFVSPCMERRGPFAPAGEPARAPDVAGCGDGDEGAGLLQSARIRSLRRALAPCNRDAPRRRLRLGRPSPPRSGVRCERRLVSRCTPLRSHSYESLAQVRRSREYKRPTRSALLKHPPLREIE